MKFLETDSLAPAPADGRHIEWLYPALKYSDRDAPNTPLNGPQRGLSEGPCRCGAAGTVLAAMAPKGLGQSPPKQLSSLWVEAPLRYGFMSPRLKSQQPWNSAISALRFVEL